MSVNAHLGRFHGSGTVHVFKDEAPLTFCGVLMGPNEGYDRVELHATISCPDCASNLRQLQRGQYGGTLAKTRPADPGLDYGRRDALGGDEVSHEDRRRDGTYGPLANAGGSSLTPLGRMGREDWRDLEDTRARDDALAGVTKSHPRAHVSCLIKVIPAEQAAAEHLNGRFRPDSKFGALWIPDDATYATDFGEGPNVEAAVWDLLQKRLQKIKDLEARGGDFTPELGPIPGATRLRK